MQMAAFLASRRANGSFGSSLCKNVAYTAGYSVTGQAGTTGFDSMRRRSIGK
jgi:hypothetical protein